MKYPDVEVQLSEADGNAFVLMGRVALALRRAGVSCGEIDEFRKEAMNGNYDHLLQTCMIWVSVS